MKVFEISDAEYSFLVEEIEIANHTQTGVGDICHGSHPARGEIVLLKIDQARFLIVAEDDAGSPLGQLLTQLERL